MKKNLDYYLKLNYSMKIYKIPDDEGGGYEVSIPILGEKLFRGDGDSIEEAIVNLNEVKKILFEEYIEKGITIQEPEVEKDEFSGRFILRIPIQLHKDLYIKAKSNSLSLNQYLIYLISSNNAFENISELIKNNNFSNCYQCINRWNNMYENEPKNLKLLTTKNKTYERYAKVG